MGCGSSNEAAAAKPNTTAAADSKKDDSKQTASNSKQEDAPKKVDAPAAAAPPSAAPAAAADTPVAPVAAAAAPAAAAAKPAKAKLNWDELNDKLPHEKGNADQKKKRFEMFDAMDDNKTGKLSLAEVTAGMEKVLQVGHVVNAPVVIRCAFNTAKLAGQKAGVNADAGGGGDFVEKNEFRLLLLYLREYFELYQLFEEVDTGDDLRVDVNEFKKASPLLEKWGVKIEDPNATFKEIDKNGGGQILFDEFAAWAMAQNLDTPDDDE